MAGFFQQLRLLLWKNALGVIRQPGWTVALLVWPLVIFIILAITRSQFPPKMKDSCYVAPRNLPSTGFFPFLQTLMCNTDSSCHNTTRLFSKSPTKNTRASWTEHDAKRVSLLPHGTPMLMDIGMGGRVRAVLHKTSDQPQIMELWDKFLNASHQDKSKYNSPMEGINNTLLGDKEALDAMLDSVNLLKKSLCSFSLMVLNVSSMSSVDPLTYGLVTFCKSNNTLLEVSLLTINQVLTELLLKDPAQALTTMGTAVVVFERLQRETSLWEGLLALPRLLMPTTPDKILNQVLDEGESLLQNIKRTIAAIESNFPEANLSVVSMVNPAIVGSINLLQHIRNWHGRDVYITLGDVIMVPPNTSVPAAVNALMQQVRIPLDKAVALTMDKALLHSYICSGNLSVELQAACTGVTMDMLLGWISADKVAQQSLLASSKDTAPGDVTFARGLVHSLMGLFVAPEGHGSSNNTRSQRSSDTQPQTIEEELFLSVSSVAVELLKGIPGWNYVQMALTTGHASMQLATTGLDTLVEMMGKVSSDAHTYQDTFLSLMSNQAAADNFAGQVMDSIVKTIMKVLISQGPVRCEDLLGQWSWLSSLSSMDPSLWNALFCPGNNSRLPDALLAEWMPVVDKATQLMNIVQGTTNANVTVPMILTEWHALAGSFVSGEVALRNFSNLLDAAYLVGWVPENITAVDWTQILMTRGLGAFITVGSHLQNSSMWPSMESYFHIAYWIMNYQPNVTASPNCTVDSTTYAYICNTGFTWQQFIPTTAALVQEFSANPAVLLRHVQGSLSFLQALYGNIATGAVTQLLRSDLVLGDGSIPALLENLITILNKDITLVSNLMSLEQFSTNSELPLSLLGEMLEALGLKPLEALWTQGGGFQAPNASSVMAIALKVAKDTRHLVTGLPVENANMPDLAGVEALLMQWLSVAQGNLTLPLSLSMGDALITYSGSFNSTSLAFLRQLLNPLTNQSSAGIADNILRAMEQLKTVLDAPNGDSTPILLGYVIQLQELLVSSLQLRRYEQLLLPDGNLTTAQVTDLHLAVVDLFQLLYVQQLSQAGDQAALQTLLQRLSALLPLQLQQQYLGMVSHFQAVMESLVSCTAAGQDCTAEVPQVLQILAASGDHTFSGGQAKPSMLSQESMKVTVNLLTLLFAWHDTDMSNNKSVTPESVLKTVDQTAFFLQQITSTPNISVSSLQQAMLQSNLTLGELEKMAALAGATNAPALLASIMGVINVQQCLEPQPNNPISLAQCALELSEKVTDFILALPIPPGCQCNCTALISLLPILVNHSVSIGLAASSGPTPLIPTTEAITDTIASIRENLQHLNLESVELISNEFHVLEGLIKLFASGQSPVYSHNSTDPLMQDSGNVQKVYLEIAQWYLRKLENVTRTSTFSELLDPFFHMAEMQLSLQLSQTEFTIFVSKEVEYLMRSIQYPINGTDVSKIGQSVIGILKGNLDLFMLNIAYQAVMGNNWLNYSLINEAETLINNELTVLEGLIELAASGQSPVYSLNSTDPLMQDPNYAQKVYLEIAQWYLRNLENETSTSAFSEILDPFFRIAEMQLALQLSQTEFTIFVSKEVEYLMRSIQYPINGTDVSKIGQSVIRILNENLNLLKLNIACQEVLQNCFGNINWLNHSLLSKVEIQIREYLNLTQDWLRQPRVTQVLTNMLHWNISGGMMNVTTPGMDLQQLLRTLGSLLTPEQQAYLTAIQHIIQALNQVLLVASQEGGLGSDQFIQAFMDAASSVLSGFTMGLTPQNGTAEIQDILQGEEVQIILQDALQLAFRPNMSNAQSLNITMEIVRRVEGVVRLLVPQEAVGYLLPGFRFISTYLETVSRPGGPDKWNEIIVNELKMVQGLLAPDSSAEVYLSVIINITHVILDSSQSQGNNMGPWSNMSLWANIGNDMTAENLAEIAGQMTGLLNSVLPLIIGQQGIMPFTLPSPEMLPDILPVLIQILTQQANQSSWDKLEGMIGALLSTLRDTPVWDSVPPAVSVMSQVMGALVNNMQAETAFILSFQKPLAVLMSELVQAVNGSDFNMADVSEGMIPAIELTVEAAIQAANRSKTLECRQVLKAWEPVREAAGLSEASLGLWCNISLLPVMEADAASNYVYANPNMTGMGMGHGTVSVDTTATMMVAALRSFYWVQVNRTIVTEQLGTMLSNTLCQLRGLNMTTEDQAHWNTQFLQLHLSQSTQDLSMALDQLDALAMDNPWMRPYLLAVEMTLNYTLENSHLLQNSTSAQHVFMEAMEILLTGMNFTEDLDLWMRPYLQAMEMTINYTMVYSQLLQNATSAQHLLMEALEMLLTGSNLTQDSIQALLTENIFSRPDGGSINKLLKDMIRELVRVQLLGDWPMVYGVMEQFLSVNTTNLILEKAIEFSGWWGSSTASGLDLVTQALPRMYEVVKAFLSTLRQMSVPFLPISEMSMELVEHVIIMLRQVSQTSDLFTTLDYYLSQLQDEMTGRSRSPPHHNEGVSRRVRRELMRREPMKEPMDDFLDLFYLDYPVLFQALAMPPTMPDIMETAHMFFGNPDLSVVLKGVSRDIGMVPPSLPPMGNVSRSMSRAGAMTWGPSVPPPLDDPIDVALGILSYLTLPRQWQAYSQLFVEIAHEDWIMEDLAKIQKLSAGLGKMADMAMVLSQHPPLQVAQRVEHMVRQLSAEVARIIYSGPNNGSNMTIQFLTAFNDILADNLEEVSDITSQINAIIQNILSSLSRPEAYMSLAPYMMALDQTIAVFTSYLPTDSLMYLNTSGQMVKGFALLVSHPRDMKNMMKATSMLSASLDHLLASDRETTLPDRKPIQSTTHPLFLNSALATHTLFNLSAASHNFSSPHEKEAMINQTFVALVAFLPEDQRIYVLPLESVLLAALSGVSNTAQIPPSFLGISKQVTMSILTMLNLTNTPTGYQGDSAGATVQVLFRVSQQVSTSLWQGLSMPQSAVHVPSVLASLNQAAMAVAPLMPDGSEHYFNVSLHILHITTMAINYTTTTGDIAGAMAVISSSVQSLLVSLSSYPSLQTAGSIIGDLEHAIQKMLQVLQSGRGPLAQTADVTQLLLHNVQGLLGLANTSMEASVARLVLAAAKMNTGHLLMMNETNWTHKLSIVLTDISNRVPEDFPYAPLIKNITMGLATESQVNLHLLLQTIQLGSELFSGSWSDGNFSNILVYLTSKVCALEDMDSIQQVMQALSLGPGFLCETAMPILQAFHIMTQSLAQDSSDLFEALFETFIGDPNTYNVNINWTSALTQTLGLNISSLKSLNINMTSPGVVKMSELLRNKTAFALEVQHYTDIPPEILHLLMETTMPNSNFQILAWLANMHHCRDPTSLQMNSTEQLLFQVFCNLPINQWYNFVVIVARYVHMENMIYRLMLSSEMQSIVGFMLQIVKFLTDMMGKLLPVIAHLQDYMFSIRDLNLVSDPEFRSMVYGKTRTMSSRATFTTVSRAMCNHGIMSLFGISKLPIMTETDPSTQQEHRMEELVSKFKIPRNATPFCMNFYLDMVNTTGGAIAWAFLKPMLLGQVLYSPDTPLTRAIIEKSNATLQQFANLKMYSQDWLQSSSYIMDSAKILNQTLPMLQNSLGNSFVQNFIEMQTDIDVSKMKDTLKNFSSTATLLEKNKDIVTQITTLSNLMMNLSSCINFDRFHGINSTEDLNTVAEHLTQTRDLYASIIFKLPKDDDDSHRKRRDASHSSSSALPPKVDYTIRMSIENSMRTDRSRNPFWVKDPYISSLKTQRYNRGFVYLQESIDRAIIETQTGQQVTEPAVQLQAFPYPCFLKDEYLNSIAFAFPLVLMIAWVLFIANFVKKLVHERELRLHEYMKMMGVNPISHFFAWFIESACFLIITIITLTIILKAGRVLPHSDGFLLFLYLSDYGLSILAISFLVSSFFDKTNIAGLSGALIYVISFFPFIIVMTLESSLSFSTKSALSLFAPTCFSYASQYITRYESQGEGIQWSNQYISPMAGDTSSFGWLCWLLLIDSVCYFIIGAYIRIVFPGKYGIAKPWYFPVMPSFWTGLFCCCSKGPENVNRGLLFSNIMKNNLSAFPNEKDSKVEGGFPSHMKEEISGLPVGVALHGLTKTYGDRAAIENLNVKFYEGQVTALLGHNGAGKTTTMSLLTGLFAPSSGTIEVYGKDMETNIDDVRQELGVCMQYDVHFDHLTTKEHLLLYGQIKAPHWSQNDLKAQVRKILEETGMYAHRHKRVGTLSGGMKRKLSISIAFIGGSRLVVLDEPTTGVDPCSRRAIWDIVIKHKKDRTIILSTHHLDEAEVLSDRIAFLERGGLKCCGSPFYLKDKLAQGYNLTLTKKVQAPDSQARFDGVEVKTFIQSYMPDARLKEAEMGDLVYSLPPFSSSNAEAYRSLLSSLDSNLDLLQLGCYGISDTTLEEVFLQLTQDDTEPAEDKPYSVSESMPDLSASRDSLPEDLQNNSIFGDKASLTGSSTVHGLALTWQQVTAMLMKRVHHSRRDWKGLFSQVVLPVVFIILAMGLGSIKSDLQHFPEMELSPALYHLGPQYSFFSNQNPNSSNLVNSMMSFPGIDNGCLNSPDKPVCTRSTKSASWETKGNSSVPFESCKCNKYQQVCQYNQYQPPQKMNPSSQIVYNLTGINVENYLLATANNYIRNRYGGFDFGEPLPTSLQMDLLEVPANRTLSKVWYNPEGHHTMPAYLNSLNNFILRTSLPAGKDPQNYAISVSSHPYPGEVQEEDAIVQGLVHILVAVCALTGYSIMTASFAIYEVQEHHSGSKTLQHISGIGEPFYWAINFFYDMALYMVPVALSIATIAAFQLPAFTDRQNLAAVSLLLVMFGFATFPWMYLLSGVFKDAEMAFISYVCINLFISTNTIISTSIVFFLGQLNENDERIHEVYSILSYVFLIFPQFSFGNGLMELARVDMQVQILSVYGVDAYKNPFNMDMLGWMFVSLFLQGFIGFTLRLLLNKWLIRKVRNLIFPKKAVPQTGSQDEDEDVVAECQRVTSGAAVTDLLQVNQLTKVYHHLAKKVQAVKRLSVGIPAGECFGLLGVNGAGKTTTFKMLTGDISPTEGTAQIKDWDGRMVDIIDCRNEGINIGYCPQVDALDDLLTGEEHMYFYARIRGISKSEIDRVVNYLLKKLELGYHRHTISDSYSCGTRRKLSTALALIGHPNILLLDEPTSGMDPRSKRHLWKIISEEVKGKCAVVLTSHSMEECEALCTRLAIMVKGQFRCLGSLQHIKNRFGSGFTVKMYLAVTSCDVEVITNFMQCHFPNTYLKDQHSSMVEYHVPVAPGGVADIFDQLESNKAALQIKHFSVSQTTLDEVFINFAMGKVGIETIPIHSDEYSEADSISLESIAASDT
ncbi:uncharacterized protein abca12 isoform X2 [Oncorhynchus masou masou]|uniref:uncharacterized protein abca12 isoform X2 n=1 Tax=Oncorhynchus masou masou TaxID=90313 RepID=UPI003182F210